MCEDANAHLNLILHSWSTFLADFTFSRGNVPWSICFILMWQRSGVLCGLAVITCTQTARDQVWSPAEAQNFFRSLIVTYLTQCYIWWPMWSLSSKCMRACFLFGWVNVIVVRCLLWSSSYDAHPDSNRPGFVPLLRHRIFSGLCPMGVIFWSHEDQDFVWRAYWVWNWVWCGDAGLIQGQSFEVKWAFVDSKLLFLHLLQLYSPQD